jgi:hypothetical protein
MSNLKLLPVLLLLFFVSCKSKTDLNSVASYVSRAENGLTKKMLIDSCEVTCQLVPGKLNESAKDDNPLEYKLYINSKSIEITDSILYQFNYHSGEMFGLTMGTDTLKPLLSERVANGRKDMHQFTILFPSPGKQIVASKASFSFLLYKNDLFKNDHSIEYHYSDIIKASKTLYGYDEVNN